MLTGCVPPPPGLLVAEVVVCVTGLPVVSDTAETVVDDGAVVGTLVDIFVDIVVDIVVDIFVDIVVGIFVDIVVGVVSLTVWEIIWVGGDVVCGGSEVVETEGVGEEVILVSVVGVAVPVVMRNLGSIKLGHRESPQLYTSKST